MAKANSQNVTAPRDGKTVYVGSDWKEVTYRTMEGNDKTVTIRTGYEIIERTIDKYGQFLLPADLEVNTWWTNTGMEDSEVIQNYHAHGECEQFHSEIKTDMDVERLPSGKFDTNELVLELTILAYNILRMIGQETIGRRKTRHKVHLPQTAYCNRQHDPDGKSCHRTCQTTDHGIRAKQCLEAHFR